jgi:hypothetical protein
MLTRRTLILAKNEAALGGGIDSTPTAALNSLLVSNCTVTPQAEMLERDLYLSTLSQLGTVTGIYWGQMTFDTELRGSGSIPTAAAPLREDPLFLACGLSASYSAGASAVYKPISSFPTGIGTATTCTLYAYLDGLLHIVTGCMGNMALNAQVGQYGKYTWTMQGAVGVIDYSPATITDDGIRDATFPASPVYQGGFSLKPPALLGANTNLQGSQECVQALTFNMNNNVVRRDCMGAPSGVAGFMITSRKPGGTVNPESNTRASGTVPNNDVWGKWRNNVGGPITFNAGNAVGNQISWNMPNSQFTQVGYGDRNGIRTFEITYAANANSDTGDDEVQIQYK